MVITSSKIVMQAHTNQPIERFAWDRSCACTSTFILFSSLPFFTSKHIFIDFVVLLHWTTQHNKSALLRFRITWQLLKKKKNMAKFAKLVWLAAVQLFYICFSFSYYPNKERERERERRERFKSNFWKGMTKPMHVVMLSLKLNQRRPWSNRHKGYSCKLMLPFCTFTSIHLACLLPLPANQVAQRSLNCSGPNMWWNLMKLGYFQCCFLQSDEQKKGQMHGLWTTKSTTRTQRRFSWRFVQKSGLYTGHLSEDRSFAWNLQW